MSHPNIYQDGHDGHDGVSTPNSLLALSAEERSAIDNEIMALVDRTQCEDRVFRIGGGTGIDFFK